MIGAIIGLILLVIFLGVVWWAGQQLLPLIPMGEPFVTIVRVLLVLILVIIVLYVISVLLGLAGIHVPYLGSALR
jgi:uncharacterized membrane protein YwzB